MTWAAENRGFAKKLLLWSAVADLFTALVIAGVGTRRVSGDALAVDDAQCVTEGAGSRARGGCFGRNITAARRRRLLTPVPAPSCAGFLLVFAVAASLLWNLLLALHMHRKMVAEKQEVMRDVVFELGCGRREGRGAKVKKRDLMAHGTAWVRASRARGAVGWGQNRLSSGPPLAHASRPPQGGALLAALLPLLAGLIVPAAGYARTAGGDLCLVGSGPQRHWWRLALLFAPLIIISAVSIGLYTGVVRRIREGMRTAMSSTAKNYAVYTKLRAAAARVAAYPTMLLLLALSCFLSWLSSLLSKEPDTTSFLFSAVALVMVLAKGACCDSPRPRRRGSGPLTHTRAHTTPSHARVHAPCTANRAGGGPTVRVQLSEHHQVRQVSSETLQRVAGPIGRHGLRGPLHSTQLLPRRQVVVLQRSHPRQHGGRQRGSGRGHAARWPAPRGRQPYGPPRRCRSGGVAANSASWRESKIARTQYSFAAASRQLLRRYSGAGPRPKTMGRLSEALARRGVLVLDGGLATELEARGHDLSDALWSARLLVDDPDAVRGVHAAYFSAGADVCISASYQASVDGLRAAGASDTRARDAIRASTGLVRDAYRQCKDNMGTDAPEGLVMASVGCFGATLANGAEYSGEYGDMGYEAALEQWHWERLSMLAETGPDGFACETLPRVDEARAVANCLGRLAACQPALPVEAWMTFCCVDDERLCSGEAFVDAVRVADACDQVVAVGINCTDARHAAGLLLRARSVTAKPLVAYPNRGERWGAETRRWRADSGVQGDAAFAALARGWIHAGARIVGGCCRVGPSTIREIRRVVTREQRGAGGGGSAADGVAD